MYSGSGAIGYVLGKIEDLLLQISPFTTEVTNARGSKSSLDARLDEIEGQLPGDIHGVPSGGTGNQILSKNSDTNYDMLWVDPPSGGNTVIDLSTSQIRNILKYGLKLSGFIAGTNAWVDTLEDVGAINTGASTGYIFDSTNKSLKVDGNNTKYEANALPASSTPAWTKNSGGTTSESISSGRLLISAGGSSWCQYELLDSNIDASKTKKLECKFYKTYSNSVNDHGFDLFIGDGTKLARVCFDNNGRIGYGASQPFTNITTGQTFTVDALWAITLDNTSGLKIFKNGVQVGSTVPYSSLPSNSTKYICFGPQNTTDVTVDYVYFDRDTNNSAATATIYWTALTSENQINTAIVEASAILGTGSIVYYISRDGGTTYTQCTLDTAIDITTQPIGTSIILKVVLTGNAELLAVAWGGKTTADSNGPTILSPKNWIINGQFDVWQRGTSSSSSGYYTADRWNNIHDIASKTHSRQAFTVGQTDVPNNPTYFSRTVITTANGVNEQVLECQKIEDVTKLAGKTVAISFWAKADASKNLSIELVQYFGTGGSTTVTGIGVQKFALTTGWVRYTAVVTIPSVSGKTIGADNWLGLYFYYTAGSTYNSRTNSLGCQSGTFDIVNICLGEGSTAFECPTESYHDVLWKCLRYYVRISGPSGGASRLSTVAPTYTGDPQLVTAIFVLPVPMRIPPPDLDHSGNLYLRDGNTDTAVTSIAATPTVNTNTIVTANVRVGTNLNTARYYFLGGYSTATQYIGFGAEL